MNLLNILGLKKEKEKEIKKEEKPKFLDEGLSLEEIDNKMSLMSPKEAKEYFHQFSLSKKSELAKNSFSKFFNHLEEDNKKCLEEHGRTLEDYYDFEHPSCSYH